MAPESSCSARWDLGGGASSVGHETDLPWRADTAHRVADIEGINVAMGTQHRLSARVAGLVCDGPDPVHCVRALPPEDGTACLGTPVTRIAGT